MSEEMEKVTDDYEAPQERIQYESERLVSQIKEELSGKMLVSLLQIGNAFERSTKLRVLQS